MPEQDPAQAPAPSPSGRPSLGAPTALAWVPLVILLALAAGTLAWLMLPGTLSSMAGRSRRGRTSR